MDPIGGKARVERFPLLVEQVLGTAHGSQHTRVSLTGIDPDRRPIHDPLPFCALFAGCRACDRARSLRQLESAAQRVLQSNPTRGAEEDYHGARLGRLPELAGPRPKLESHWWWSSCGRSSSSIYFQF